MKSSCFCTPIHPKKFKFAKGFIESYNRLYDDTDIFFVFSNQNDHSLFYKSNPRLKYNPIIMRDDEIELSHYGVNGPVTYKKWYGLRYIFDNTEFQYVATVDDDSLFIKSVDYDELFKKKYLSNVVFANNVRADSFDVSSIHNDSSMMFSDADQTTLTQIMKTSTTEQQYFWVNDIPIYRRDHFEEFAAYINLENIWTTFDTWTFDHVCYVYFLLLKHYVTLINVDVVCPYGLLEQKPLSRKDKQYNKIFKAIQQMNPMWIQWHNHVDLNQLPNVFMRLSTDRV